MNDLAQATREIMWNVSGAWVMYALFLAAMAVFAYGVYRRASYWRRGRPENEPISHWFRRLGILVRELLFQKKVRESRFPGIFHSLIFYSFLVLILTTAVVALDYDFGTSFFRGYLYVFLTVAAELAGVLILIGVGMAAWRRYVVKPETLKTSVLDGWSLGLIAGIVVTGFLVEGLRIAHAGDPWKALSPVGYGVALLFGGVAAETTRTAHVSLWWIHTVLAMGWIASIPYTKFFHLLALPTNIFLAKLAPRGALRHEDIAAMMESEDIEDMRVGEAKPEDLTWKQRLDFDACISCGRCEEVCPAFLAQQDFSPKQMIAGLKEAVHASENGKVNGNGRGFTPGRILADVKAAFVRTRGGNGGGVGAEEAPAAADADSHTPAQIVGDVFNEEYIWNCRTCTACMEVCPALINHVDTLIEIRRNEVLMQGRLPAEAMAAMKTMETMGNPFGSPSVRNGWLESLDLRVIRPGEECDVLYWIGCSVGFDPTKQRIAEDIGRILKHCEIRFGILGQEENCCGDPARVIGQEMLFQQVARQQVEILNSRKFRLLLTSCPHCYNVLKNEYPQFGGRYEVMHHSEFFHEMIWRGSLLPSLGFKGRYVYHDPCYLGRYQKIYDAPREVIRSIPGADVLEMKNHRQKAMCCGGGGGHFWMDIMKGERINTLRVKQAIDAKADTIVTGCAYCLQMIEDSIKLTDQEENIRAVDLATLVMESLPNPSYQNLILPASCP